MPAPSLCNGDNPPVGKDGLSRSEPFDSDQVGEDGAGGDKGENDSMPLMVAGPEGPDGSPAAVAPPAPTVAESGFFQRPEPLPSFLAAFVLLL